MPMLAYGAFCPHTSDGGADLVLSHILGVLLNGIGNGLWIDCWLDC